MTNDLQKAREKLFEAEGILAKSEMAKALALEVDLIIERLDKLVWFGDGIKEEMNA